MFKKLLKYDMASVAKFWWIGAVISLASAVVGAVCMRIFVFLANFDAEEIGAIGVLTGIFSLFFSFFCIFTIFLSGVLTFILVFIRFYKHFFTDEGYLTFTLPASRSTHFLSKTVNAFFWVTLHYIVLIASILLLLIVFVLLLLTPEDWRLLFSAEVLEYLSEIVKGIWSKISIWFFIYAIETIAYGFVSSLFSVTLIHFCITFGSIIVKKAKVILSLGIYYTISGIFSFISQFAIYFWGLFMSEGYYFLLENAPMHQQYAVAAILLLMITAMIGAFTAILYSTTQHLLERKLNLA